MTRILLIAVLAITIALAMVNARLMNKRDHIWEKFERLSRTNPEQMHEFRIALKQKNLDTLEATLLDVSNPDSPNYGKWWTSEQILDLIAPSTSEITPVVAWLKSFNNNGVSEIDLSGRDFIKVKATIRVIEQMFSTQMFDYRSRETGKILSRVFGSVHIPEHLTIIDMIAGITELVRNFAILGNKNQHRSRSAEQTDPLGIIYPGQLRNMYKIPKYYPVNGASQFGVIEFNNDASFNMDDLSDFNGAMNENVLVTSTIGPYRPNNPDTESTLDIQYGGAMALNSTLWFWTVTGWMYDFATDLFSRNYFPIVVSMSWGYPEDEQCQISGCLNSFDYVNKVNVEFMKIGLKGITLLAASGDKGAPGIEPMPSWQSSFVNSYLKSGVPLPNPQFNASNRAYPDVAANGHNYGLILKKKLTTVGGTSASTPVFGAVIALLNSYLINHGKTPIGFANPLLYKMYAADATTFTDITTGNNYCTEICCGNVGFVATKGWDPVTGLGTPMFPRMRDYLRKNVVEKK